MTPKVVMEVLAKLGVERVGDLDQGQRRTFVDEVQAAVDAKKIPF